MWYSRFFRSNPILIFIILIAFLLRFINIESNPPSLYGDELTLVYDSYSLLKTGGFDQTGQFLPLTFSMGAGRPAGYVYFTLPFVAFFGPTALGVRGLSILSGVGLVFLIYILGKLLISKKVGLGAAFLAAISPWSISLSRGGFEANFALFLATLGVVSLILAEKNKWFYILCALSFGFALHTYPTYKLVLPFFWLILIWFKGGLKYFIHQKLNLASISALPVFLIFIFTAVAQSFVGGSENRFLSINVISQQEIKQNTVQKINSERNLNSLPTSVSKYFHNQPLEYIFITGQNYLDNFSLDFLFLHGDGNPRHNMANIGGFYLIEIITLLLGIISLSKSNSRVLLFLISWLLVAPLATAIVDQPHALRSAFMLPALLLISASGLVYLYETSKSTNVKILSVLVILGLLIQFLFFTEKLFFVSPNLYSNFWSYPAKMASNMAMSKGNNFDYIIISDKIDNVEFAYPVYAKVDPRLVISQNKRRFILNELSFKKFNNVYIGYIPDSNIEKFLASLTGKILFIGSSDQKKYLSNYQTLNSKNGQEALVIKNLQN